MKENIKNIYICIYICVCVYIYIYIKLNDCCTSETNTVNQLYFNKFFLKCWFFPIKKTSLGKGNRAYTLVNTSMGLEMAHPERTQMLCAPQLGPLSYASLPFGYSRVPSIIIN